MLKRYQENIVNMANISQDLKTLSKMLGGEYTEIKVATTILNLARKNLINKDLAKKMLKGTTQEKHLNYEFKTNLIKS